MSVFLFSLRWISLFMCVLLSYSAYCVDGVGVNGDTRHKHRICTGIERIMGEGQRQWLQSTLNRVDASKLQDFEEVHRGLHHKEMNIGEHQKLILTIVEATSKMHFRKEDFIAVCKALFHTNMSSLNRVEVTECVARIGGDFSWLNDFKETCLYLISKGTDRMYVIKSVSQARPFLYDAFIKTCTPLMDIVKGEYEKGLVMEAVLRVDNADKRQVFLEVCKALCEKVPPYDKVYIIESVSRVPSERYAQFKNTCERLAKRVNHPVLDVVEVVSDIASEKYTENFVTMCADLSSKLLGKDKIRLIKVVSYLDEAEYGNFKEVFDELSEGLSGGAVDKSTSQHFINIVDVLLLMGRPLWRCVLEYKEKKDPRLFSMKESPLILPNLISMLERSNGKRALTRMGLESMFFYLSEKYLLPDVQPRKRQRE